MTAPAVEIYPSTATGIPSEAAPRIRAGDTPDLKSADPGKQVQAILRVRLVELRTPCSITAIFRFIPSSVSRLPAPLPGVRERR